MKENLLNELRRIENQLSPENLCMDGEASPNYVRQRGAQLRRERNWVIQQLGYEPSSKELWGWR